MMAVDEYRSNLNLEAPHERSNKQRETERSKMARGQNIKKRCQTSRSSGDRIACSPAEAEVGNAPDHDHTPSFRFGGDWWAKCKRWPRSKYNAITHGIFGPVVLEGRESPKEYDRLV